MQPPVTIPITQGLYQERNDGVYLMGTRCNSCQTHFFPRALSCRNPACRDKQVTDALLGPSGTLYSYTLQAYQPPGLFRMNPWQPYVIALVELPQGLRVMGMMTDCTPQDLQIGMPVQLTTEPLYHDAAGSPVLTYKFMPVSVRDAARPGVSA
jgi:uncharacterized protein